MDILDQHKLEDVDFNTETILCLADLEAREAAPQVKAVLQSKHAVIPDSSPYIKLLQEAGFLDEHPKKPVDLWTLFFLVIIILLLASYFWAK